MAVLAVFVSAAGIGFTLSVAGGVPLTVALLVGAIVATNDPAVVVGIFRDLGVPLRLVRLVEGESLLNDAAAIVLFVALLKIIGDGTQPSLAASAVQFAISFGGGLLLGFIGGRLFGALVSFLGGAKLAEATLALAFLHQCNLLVGKWAYFLAVNRDSADQYIVFEHWYGEL